jgi:hypothetical protein
MTGLQVGKSGALKVCYHSAYGCAAMRHLSVRNRLSVSALINQAPAEGVGVKQDSEYRAVIGDDNVVEVPSLSTTITVKLADLFDMVRCTAFGFKPVGGDSVGEFFTGDAAENAQHINGRVAVCIHFWLIGLLVN